MIDPSADVHGHSPHPRQTSSPEQVARRLAAELALIERVYLAISSSLDLGTVLGQIAEQLTNALGCTSTYISAYSASDHTLTVLGEYVSAAATPAEAVSDLGVTYHLPMIADLLQSVEPVVFQVDDPQLDAFIREHLASFGGQTVLQLPIMLGGEKVAIASLWDSRQRRMFSNEELQLAQRIVGYAAVALQNAQLYQRAQQELSERVALEAELVSAREAALAASRLKSSFLANVSHEIRTPMNGVIGMLDLLLQSPLSEQQREYARIARESGTALLALLNDILDISKIEAGKLTLQRQPFDLRLLVHDVLGLFGEQAASAGLFLEAVLPPDLPALLVGDPSRLRQVLVNLVGNAVKFTPSGGVRVCVSQQEQWFQFDVIDSGIGLSDAEQVQLFQPFNQLDGSTTRRYGGSGLGLAISRDLVELMGGTISVASRAGEGSTFSFSIPLTSAPLAAPTPVAARPSGAQPSWLGSRVLVVEDNPVNQLLLHEQLRRLGCEIQLATSGVEALRALDEREFDLVLMDVQMPDLDGLATTAEIRRHERHRRLPIVAVTAHALRGDRERCLAAGMDDYLAKPVTQDALAEMLRRWLPLPEQPEDGLPVLDPEVLAQLRALNAGSSPSVLNEIIDLFLEDTPERMEDLRHAIAAGEAELLRTAAHSLKGSSSNLGATRLGALCRQFEILGLEGRLREAAGGLEQLEREYARVCRALLAERADERERG
jgi:signal transduction histidine kinase/DNA-binding NarL/FixJ family response regulator